MNLRGWGARPPIEKLWRKGRIDMVESGERIELPAFIVAVDVYIEEVLLFISDDRV